MKARLLILIALAAGIGGYFAVTRGTSDNSGGAEVDGPEQPAEVLELWKYPLGGEDPPEPPELAIQVYLDPDDGKNRIYFTLSEAHGYYVETFRIQFWHKETGEDTSFEDSRLRVSHYLNNYLKENDTLRDCIEVTDIELRSIDDDIGTDENWEARIVDFGRARVRRIGPYPPVIRPIGCGD